MVLSNTATPKYYKAFRDQVLLGSILSIKTYMYLKLNTKMVTLRNDQFANGYEPNNI